VSHPIPLNDLRVLQEQAEDPIRIRAGELDLPVAVLVEERADLVGRVGDVAVQRHRCLHDDRSHDGPSRHPIIACCPPAHRDSVGRRRDHGAAVAPASPPHRGRPHRDGDQALFVRQPITATERGGTSLLATRSR
jgi:hypothetical protein